MRWLRISHRDAFGWRDALLGLALVAALVRSLIPQGFMPEFNNGEMTIVICTANGADTLSIAGGESHPLKDVFAAVHGPCAFSALATLASPPAEPVFIRRVSFKIIQGEIVVPPGDARLTVLGPHAPRGPPVQA